MDDIAAHWWVNLGYKYPPVHYYLTPAMRKNGLPAPTNVPALTYTERTKPTAIKSEQISKPMTTPTTPPRSRPLPPLLPPHIPVQNGHSTDTQSKTKAISMTNNGYQSLGRAQRLQSHAMTSVKSNQPIRRTSMERNHQVFISTTKPASMPTRALIY